jgi:peroxiredoxin
MEERRRMNVKAARHKRAIPFELRDHSGRLHTLEDFAGLWLLLVFHRHLA